MTMCQHTPTECPRCENSAIELMVNAPKESAWQVYICQHCLYSWRTTESLAQTHKDYYDRAFKITDKQISTMMISPPSVKR